MADAPTWGGIVAAGLFVLSSLFILIALSWVYMAFGNVPVIAGLFYGIKPPVTALVVHAAWRIVLRALKNAWLWSIAAASFVAIFALDAPLPLIVLAAGLIRHFGGRYAPDKFKTGSGHGQAAKAFGPALIDDNTPAPAHTLFSWGGSARCSQTFFARTEEATGASLADAECSAHHGRGRHRRHPRRRHDRRDRPGDRDGCADAVDIGKSIHPHPADRKSVV